MVDRFCTDALALPAFDLLLCDVDKKELNKNQENRFRL